MTPYHLSRKIVYPSCENPNEAPDFVCSRLECFVIDTSGPSILKRKPWRRYVLELVLKSHNKQASVFQNKMNKWQTRNAKRKCRLNIMWSELEITLCSQRCVYSQKVRTLSCAMSQIITKTWSTTYQFCSESCKIFNFLSIFYILFNHWQ